NSIHSPANRNNYNNNRNSNPRFPRNSTFEQDSTHSTPSISVTDLKEFTDQLKRLETVITRLDDSFSHLAAKFDDVNSRLVSLEENMDTDHRPNPSLWNKSINRSVMDEDATSNVSESQNHMDDWDITDQERSTARTRTHEQFQNRTEIYGPQDGSAYTPINAGWNDRHYE